MGNDIILYHKRRDSSSPAAELSVGHFVSDSIYVRATARYLGCYHFSGSAGFPFDPTFSVGFDQDYCLRARGLYAGLGYEKNFGPAVFMDVSVEAGAASLHSVSTEVRILAIHSATLRTRGRTSVAAEKSALASV